MNGVLGCTLFFCLYFCYKMLKCEDCVWLLNKTSNVTVPAPVPESFSGCLQTLSSACWSPRCTASHPDSLNSSTWSSDLWDQVRERKGDREKKMKRETVRQDGWKFMMSTWYIKASGNHMCVLLKRDLTSPNTTLNHSYCITHRKHMVYMQGLYHWQNNHTTRSI